MTPEEFEARRKRADAEEAAELARDKLARDRTTRSASNSERAVDAPKARTDEEKQAGGDEWEPPPGYQWASHLSPEERAGVARMFSDFESDPAGGRARHVRRNRRLLGWATVAMVPLTWAAGALPGTWALLSLSR